MKKGGSFIGGILLGAVTSAVLHMVFFRPPFPFPPGHRPEMMGRMMFDRISEDLMLTPEQRKLIEPIMLRLNLKMWEARLANQARIEGILEEADEEIGRHLSPTQRERLAQQRSRMREEREKDLQFLHQRRKELGFSNE